MTKPYITNHSNEEVPSNHFLDHTQIFNLSLNDQTIQTKQYFKNPSTEDDLKYQKWNISATTDINIILNKQIKGYNYLYNQDSFCPRENSTEILSVALLSQLVCSFHLVNCTYCIVGRGERI
jgi:hypothetical protein